VAFGKRRRHMAVGCGDFREEGVGVVMRREEEGDG
jgi:hypothetical protein